MTLFAVWAAFDRVVELKSQRLVGAVSAKDASSDATTLVDRALLRRRKRLRNESAFQYYAGRRIETDAADTKIIVNLGTPE
ncbi:MAG TPA: hypothetical protein DDW52_06370 [Planctomycetaceae bacterium]|nr:hypothetical protein [Planctomycetaceae bacterium]